MKAMTLETDDKRKTTHLDFQFCVAVYIRTEYETHGEHGTSNLYYDWGGIEFGNTWKDAIKHAQEIVEKNPEYLCVVIDKLNRKKPQVV